MQYLKTYYIAEGQVLFTVLECVKGHRKIRLGYSKIDSNLMYFFKKVLLSFYIHMTKGSEHI